MRYRLAAVLFAALVLTACTMWTEHPVKAWSDATGGEGLERVFWQEVQTKNWTGLEQHLAGNFVSVTPEEGRLDRAGFLDHLKQANLEEYSLGDVQVEMNTQTLVVTYTITLRGTFKGQPLPSTPVHMMTIWQKQKAGWMAIAHSVMG
jgi:hypothetical protein